MIYYMLYLASMVSPFLGLMTFLTGLVFPSKKSEASARGASDLQELSLLVSQWLDKNRNIISLQLHHSKGTVSQYSWS